MLIQEHEFREARHPLKPTAESKPTDRGLSSSLMYTLAIMMSCVGKAFRIPQTYLRYSAYQTNMANLATAIAVPPLHMIALTKARRTTHETTPAMFASALAY